jgi:hypothetical protein
MKFHLAIVSLACFCAAAALPVRAQTPSAPSSRVSFVDIAPPSSAAMAEICKGTDDLRECGKRIEAQQIRSASGIVERNGRVLSITQLPNGKVHFLDEGGAEAGESFSLFGFHAIAQAVTLYHTKADKLGFIVLSRRTGAGSAVPNEPIFQSSGEQFVTVDVCKRDCEQRITWWKISLDGIRRHAEFITPASWSEASAAWSPSGSVWVEFVNDEGKRNTELSPTDARWNFAK